MKKETCVEKIIENLLSIVEEDLVAAQQRLSILQRLNNSGMIQNLKLKTLMQDRERALSIYETATAEALEVLRYSSIFN